MLRGHSTECRDQVIAERALSREAPRVGDALEFLLAYGARRAEGKMPLPVWMPTPANRRYRRELRILDRMIQNVVQARRNDPQDGHGLLDLLLAATDEEGTMSGAQLRDELVTMALAGHETTANGLAFTWYLLSKHPGVRRGLASEINAHLGSRRPRFDDLDALCLVDQVVKESLRLFPPAWIVERQALAPDVVAGYALPPRALVGIAPYTLHRDPRWWPNPEGFEPNRFKPEPEPSRPRYGYLPFGGGPRICVGKSFAMMELKLVLIRMIQRVNLELRPGFCLALDPGITLRPKDGVGMRVSWVSESDAAGAVAGSDTRC